MTQPFYADARALCNAVLSRAYPGGLSMDNTCRAIVQAVAAGPSVPVKTQTVTVSPAAAEIWTRDLPSADKSGLSGKVQAERLRAAAHELRKRIPNQSARWYVREAGIILKWNRVDRSHVEAAVIGSADMAEARLRRGL
jgi:hypothetical protein